MIIEKLSECTGASRFGSCNECGIGETDIHNLYRLAFRDVSVCLCEDCLKEVQKIFTSEKVVKALKGEQGNAEI